VNAYLEGGAVAKAGRLYVVATPIGNLEDISPRALDVLRRAAVVAAEDTRHSQRLFAHYEIQTRLISYHEHNETERVEELIGQLRAGEDVALISDAGTPCISDPGYRIVHAAHEAHIEIVSVPGPSSVIAALSISGLPTDCFAFHGFFPRKINEAKTLLKKIETWSGATHIFFEAANRLKATLQTVATQLPGHQASVCRELTKVYEEATTGTIEHVLAHYFETEVRGECVLLVHVPRATGAETELTSADLKERVEQLIEREGMTRRDAIRRVSEKLGVSRNRVYSAATGQEDE
jgi:16S rRNA (cytidine1402-2'-O)-methyltransferase